MRYFLGFLIAIGLIILIIILLVRAIFGGGGTEPRAELLTYNRTGTVMRLTIQGRINSNQEHRQVQISISQRQNEVRTIAGYENTTLDSRQFDNNSNAYGVFLRAIDLQGFTRGNDSEALMDERGYCPTGQRYVYEIIENDQVTQRYWSTSCNGVKSFQGNTGQVNNLFQAQIPGYNEFVSDVNL